tara:strand:- start:904 stop:4119 length:3216 start_codon:yes stop_codon:yes gene_type:complete
MFRLNNFMVFKKEVVFIVSFLFLLGFIGLVDGAATFDTDVIQVPSDGDSPYNCQSIAEDVDNDAVISFTNTTSFRNCTLNYNISLQGTLNIFNETWFMNGTSNGSTSILANGSNAFLNVSSANITNNGTITGNVWLIDFTNNGDNSGGVFIKDSHMSYYGYSNTAAFTGIAVQTFNLTLINNTLTRGYDGIFVEQLSTIILIANNTIRDCTYPDSGVGIRLQNNAQNATIQNNTIANCPVGIALTAEDHKNIVISNNTIINATGKITIRAGNAVSGAGISINASNNINVTYNKFIDVNVSIYIMSGDDDTYYIYGNEFNTPFTDHVRTNITVFANLSTTGNWYSDLYNTSLQDTGIDGFYDEEVNESDTAFIAVSDGGSFNDKSAVVCKKGWETNTSCVYLVSPLNGSSSSYAGRNLTYFPGGNLNLTNCTLLTNFSGVSTINQTNISITTGILNNFTAIGIPSGGFTWDISCVNNNTNTITTDGNYTFSALNTPPVFGFRNVTKSLNDENISDTNPQQVLPYNHFSGLEYAPVGFIGGAARVLYNFSMPTAPNASITSAILKISRNTGSGPGPTPGAIMNFTAYMVNNSWLKGNNCNDPNAGCVTNDTSNGTTWNSRYNGTAWDNAGGDFYTHINSSEINFSTVGIELIEFTLTTIAGYWHNGTYANLGVILKDESEADALVVFETTNDTKGIPPVLDINYTLNDITTNDSSNVTINLSYYFQDDDNHALAYGCRVEHNLSTCVDNSDGTITILPQNEVYGNVTMYINATDNEFNEDATSNAIKLIVNDTIVPFVSEGLPTGVTEDVSPTLSFLSDENAVCRGTIDTDESYGEMDFGFDGINATHEYTSGDLSTGDHTVYVSCRDPSGNTMGTSASWTFTVSRSLGSTLGGGGSSGGSAVTKKVVTPSEPSESAGTSKKSPIPVGSDKTYNAGLVQSPKYFQVDQGGEVTFLANEVQNAVTVTNVAGSTATFEIENVGSYTLSSGGVELIDLDGDGVAELVLTLESINEGQAVFSLEEVSAEEALEVEERLELQQYAWVWILLFAVIAGVIIYIYEVRVHKTEFKKPGKK